MEKHIKERLVGAIVLVAIVVIVVPELLTGPRERVPEAPPSEVVAPVRTVTIDLATGAQRDAAAAERIADLPVESGTPAPPTLPPLDAPRGEVERATPAPSGGVAPDASTSRDGLAAAQPPAAGSPATTAGPARAAVADSASSPAAATPAPAPKPEPSTRPDAGSTVAAPPATTSKPLTASKPETAAKPDGVAKPGTAPKPAATPRAEPPTKPAAATTPPRPAAPSTSAAEGWVVQLGSFASRPNAERLAAELRSKGYAGFVSEFRGSGRVLYRVRVGPEQDRARAEAIAQRLARDGKKGSVTPHP